MRTVFLAALLVLSACTASKTDGGAVAATASAPPPAVDSTPPPTTIMTTPPEAAPIAKLDFKGHPVEVELASEPGVHRSGEPWALVYRVKNLSSAPLYVIDGGDYRNGLGRQESYRVRATLNGAPLPVKDAGMQMGGMSGPHAITKGHPYEQKLLVPRWIDVTSAGAHLFSVEKGLHLGEGGIDHVDFASTTEVPTMTSVVVKIEPATPETVGALIDAFGARMLGANDDDAFDAANRLDFVSDPRAIKPYAAVVTKWAGSDEHSRIVYESVHALGRYKEKEARDAVVHALGVSDPILHLAATQSLAAQETPESLALLWSLKNDPDPNVRTTITQAVARQAPPDVEAKLRDMTNDRDATVASEAKRLLALVRK